MMPTNCRFGLWSLGGLLVLLCSGSLLLAQTAATSNLLAIEAPAGQTEQDVYQNLRLGIMVQGQAEALYSWFGHAGIVLSGPEADLQAVAWLNRENFADASIYNGEELLFDYGNFDATGKFFVLKFLEGELNYYKYYKNFQRYIRYNAATRKQGMEVYWLNLHTVEKRRLVEILFRETSEANRLYKYDFYFDNCLTRIRDQLNEAFAGKLQSQITGQSPWSIREILRREIGDKFWGLLLLEFLQGAKIDQKYSRWDSMFFPSHIPGFLQQLTVPGSDEALIAERETIFPFRPEEMATVHTDRFFRQNLRYLWLYAIGLVLLACFFWQKKGILPLKPAITGRSKRKTASHRTRKKTSAKNRTVSPRNRERRLASLWLQRLSYFALCLFAGSIIAAFSAVLWFLTILQSFDVALQNIFFLLGTPFLLLEIPLLVLLFWKRQRQRFARIWLWLWRVHAILALLLPLFAWLYSLITQQRMQNILLPWLAVLPILLVCAFIPSDILSAFSQNKSSGQGQHKP